MTRSPGNEGLQVSAGPQRGLSKLPRELSQTVPLADLAAQVLATSGVLQGRPSRERAGGITSGWDMALCLCSCPSSPRCSYQHSAPPAAGLSKWPLGPESFATPCSARAHDGSSHCVTPEGAGRLSKTCKTFQDFAPGSQGPPPLSTAHR